MTAESGIKPSYDQVTVYVPGSTANLGPYFDKAGAALSKPLLKVTLERVTGREIEFQALSSAPTPDGRRRGYAGAVALEIFLYALGIKPGLRLTFEDTNPDGFPTGGTGLSGAESVGAILSAAIMFNRHLTPREVVLAGAKGEPGEHKDNVAPSTLGGIVFMSDVPGSENTLFYRVTPPQELGLAIGFSSHQKTGGTESTRNVLNEPVESAVLVKQVGRAVVGALSLQTGNVGDFLKLVYGDEYHEPRRADAGLYGDFSAEEFFLLKQELYQRYRIALAVSGAGPNMQFWFDNRNYRSGLTYLSHQLISSWFANHGINMLVEEIPIDRNGAYFKAKQAYPDSALTATA